MRKSMFVLPLVLGAAGGMAMAGPAAAADSDVTVEVTAGTLSISAPAAPVDLGTVTASTTAQTVAAPLGDVTVTDTRGGVDGWVAAVAASPVLGTTLGGQISYTTPAAVVVGVSTVTNADAADILTSSNVQTASAVSGANTAVWSPSISVTLPAGAQVGTYTSVVTHSVA
ncbi:MAG: hypothetical protein KJ548_13345 [Actinobacteria bacterium]|nr:hypothetical protein [Actinomycetota bacterium]MCG2800883.1 hypothetical protein [Cellulomonas sp.]